MNTPAVKDHKAVPSVSAMGLFNLNHKQMISFASEVATELAKIVEAQKLYNQIQGKKYVRVEGWNTMGAMLGIVPREVGAEEQKDGSYIGTVELYQVANDKVVGRGSALCGMDERKWKNSDKYARRSMSVTRATGKAFRIGYSWIMAMAGYEVTPFEEMPFDDHQQQSDSNKPIEPQVVNHPVDPNPAPEKEQGGPERIYRGTDAQIVGVMEYLDKKGIPVTYHDDIHKALMDKPITILPDLVKRYSKKQA